MLIATYGTLRKGQRNYCVNEMADATYVFTGKTKECYDMYYYCASYPSVSLAHNEHQKQVVVEVYDAPDTTLYDMLEGYPHFYNRSVITVLDEDGNEHAAHIYHIDQKYRAPIKSGDWLNKEGS